MTEEQIKSIFAEAQRQTSAGQARLRFALKTTKNSWTLIFSAAAGELAIQVDEPEDGSPQKMRDRIADQLRRLF